MFGFADIAFSFEEKFGIIPGILIFKEGGGCSFIDGDELGRLLDFDIIQIGSGSSLGLIHGVEDLAVYLELRGLAAVADSPFSNGSSLALCFQ